MPELEQSRTRDFVLDLIFWVLEWDQCWQNDELGGFGRSPAIPWVPMPSSHGAFSDRYESLPNELLTHGQSLNQYPRIPWTLGYLEVPNGQHWCVFSWTSKWQIYQIWIDLGYSPSCVCNPRKTSSVPWFSSFECLAPCIGESPVFRRTHM